MKHRSPLAVFFLPIITLGIYSLVWHVKTKNEMNKLGANIPTAWLLIVPIVNWYWLWKYSEGVEKVTGGQTSGVLAFVLLFLLGFIGMAIIQNEFNKLAASPVSAVPVDNTPAAPALQPAAPIGPQPDASFGGPIVASPTEPAETVADQPLQPTFAPPLPNAAPPEPASPVSVSPTEEPIATPPEQTPPQPPQSV